MEKRVHLILACWIASHIGHTVLSLFYEKSPAVFYVPIIHGLFILIMLGAWKRHRRSAKICALIAVATILIQGRFIWVRDAYGALSIPVLVFDIFEVVIALLYLVFFFSSQRERYLVKPPAPDRLP